MHERALGAAPGALLLDAGCMGIEMLTRLAERETNVLYPSEKTSDADWQRRKSGRYFDKREFVRVRGAARSLPLPGPDASCTSIIVCAIGAERATSAIGARNVAIARPPASPP
jgi:hypothetical protein